MIRITARLVLRPHPRDESAIAREIQWLNDKNVTRYSEQRHRQHTTETQLEYYSSIRPFDHLHQIWLGSMHIGNLSAVVDPANQVANVGIMIGDSHQWGLGFGLEAWRGFLGLLLYDYAIRKVEAGCMSENDAMARIAIQSGMQLEATIPDHFMLDDEPTDLLLFGKTAF